MRSHSEFAAVAAVSGVTSPVNAGRALRRRHVLPGFRLTLGCTMAYVSLLILLPLAAVFIKTGAMGWDEFVNAVATPRAFAAYRLTFGMAFLAAAINATFGLVVAWVLVRYPSALTRVFDAMVDLPFAMPTAVAGIALTAVYSANGWLGRYLVPLGIDVAFTRLGVLVALTFVGLPFVVRTVQPVLQDLESDVEEAAASLGAPRLQAFRRVILPAIMPAVLSGFTLAFARALGEYGSVIFISGNMPMRTEITTLLIVTKLEQYDYTGATAIATVMLVASFLLLLVINLLQAWTRSRMEAA